MIDLILCTLLFPLGLYVLYTSSRDLYKTMHTGNAFQNVLAFLICYVIIFGIGGFTICFIYYQCIIDCFKL